MANTASRLSANGSLTISGYFNEILKPFVTSGLIAYWDTEKGYSNSKSTWVDLTDNNTVITFSNPNFTSNTGNITFTRPNNNYGRANLPQLAGATAITVEGVMSILDFAAAMPFGFGGYDVYTNGGYMGFNTASSDLYGISPATVVSLGLAGKYIHYAFVMAGPGINIPATNQIWINGVQQSLSQQLGTTTTSPGFNNDNNNFAFALNGWTRNDTFYFENITYTSLRIYNRALTPNEIKQNYNLVAPKWVLTPISEVTNSDVTSLRANTLLAGGFNEVDYNQNNIGPTKNMFANSEDFTQQFTWGTNSITLAKNSSIAPDGKQTATLITGTGFYPLIIYYHPSRTNYQGLFFGELGKYYTQSLFVKYVNQRYCVFVCENWAGTGNGVQFDLINGTVTGPNQQAVATKIENYGNGWWRISVTILIPFARPNDSRGYYQWTPQWRMGFYDGTNYTGSQMLVWGMQLEEGNTASTYVATGFPKNILTFTNDFGQTNNWYAENCNVSNSPALDPNGNYKGQLLSSTITGGTNTGFVQESLYNLPINTDYTYSVYLKQGTSPTTYLNFYNISPYSELVAIVTWPSIQGNAPTVSYSGGATRLNATVTRAANGWWRFSLSMNNGTSSGLVWRIYTTTNGTSNVPGYNVYIWGPQLEFGLTPTTYIENGSTFTNILPLANTNTLMKTTNTGNTFIKDTFDEVTGNISNTDNLIGYYDAAKTLSYPDTGSTWFDLSSSRNHATLNSSPTFSTDTVGYNYFNFDGINNTGNIPNFNLQQDFTLECWVKHQRVNGFSFFGHGTTSPNQGLHIWFNNPDSIRIGMYANDTDFYGLSTNTNQWYHYVFTYQNSAPWTKQAFRNGIALTPTVVYTPAQYTGLGPLRIGAIYGFGTTLGYGQFGHVKIYNKVLSQTEVTQNFNELRGRYGI